MDSPVPLGLGALQNILALLKKKEPEFTIGGIPVYFHPLAPHNNMWIIAGGEVIFVHKDGHWKKWSKEQFTKVVLETISENNRPG